LHLHLGIQFEYLCFLYFHIASSPPRCINLSSV
jgi:hypothetical protein